MRRSILKFASVVSVLLLSAGGSEAGPKQSKAPPPPSGAIRGTVDVPTGVASQLVQEREPNDSVSSAPAAGVLRAGSTLTLAGRIAGERDPQDGFRLNAPTRVQVVARLSHATARGQDFDLLVYDVATLRVVAASRESALPKSVRFAARGVFDVVVRRRAGAGAYLLALDVLPIPGDGIDEEFLDRNGESRRAVFLGSVEPGEAAHVDGFIWAKANPRDALTASIPFDASVRFSLRPIRDLPPTLSVEVKDVTEGKANARSLGLLRGSAAAGLEGVFAVPARTLLSVEVVATKGSAIYKLDIAASAPPSESSARRSGAAANDAAALDDGVVATSYGAVATNAMPGEVLVRPAPRANADALTRRMARRGYAFVDRIPGGLMRFRARVPESADTDEIRRVTTARAAVVASDSDVASSATNAEMRASYVPDDPRYAEQWHYPMINLPAAWDATLGSASAIVAVVDTGGTYHPDMEGQLVPGYDFVSWSSISGDGDGIDADPMGSPAVIDGHGTHVAGTIAAASGNHMGAAGVAPRAKVMHVRVLGTSGRGSMFDVLNGVLYAAGLPNVSRTVPARRASVINLSLGGGGYQSDFADAVASARAAGVVVVAAAGNEATDELSYPAAYDGVIAVGSVERDSTLAYYSNYGSWVDLVAPGGGEFGGVLSLGWSKSGSTYTPAYVHMSGTSMASPHVAGVAALVLSVNPGLKPAAVEAILNGTTKELGSSGFDTTFGYGLLDAQAAVARARIGAPTTPVLTVAPSPLDLGWSSADGVALIRNSGVGRLVVGAPEVIDGAPWLSAALEGRGDTTRNVDRLRVTVRRELLPVGPASGLVRLRAGDGRPVDLTVTLEVVDLSGNGLAGVPVFALLLDADGATIASQRTSGTSRTFAFERLPAGTYQIVAGTDVDQNGTVGGRGELLGRFGGDRLAAIRLAAREARSGLKVVVTPPKEADAPTYRR